MINIKLESNDKRVIEIPLDMARKSPIIADILTTFGINNPESIPLLKVNGTSLAYFAEWVDRYSTGHGQLTSHNEANSAINRNRTLSKWENHFFASLDDASLVTFIAGMQYLGFEEALNGSCLALANRIKDKTTEQIRVILGVQNTFDQDEEEAISKQIAWMADL